MRYVISALIVFALAMVAAFFWGVTYNPPPAEARFVIDKEHQTYASIPCVIFGDTERDLITNQQFAKDPGEVMSLKEYAEIRTWGRIKHSQLKKDQKCLEVGGFSQRITIIDKFLGYPSRWADDGRWVW